MFIFVRPRGFAANAGLWVNCFFFSFFFSKQKGFVNLRSIILDNFQYTDYIHIEKFYLALACSFLWPVHQLDFESAFLNGNVKSSEPICPAKYLNIPNGKVLRLNKALHLKWNSQNLVSRFARLLPVVVYFLKWKLLNVKLKTSVICLHRAKKIL